MFLMDESVIESIVVTKYGYFYS